MLFSSISRILYRFSFLFSCWNIYLSFKNTRVFQTGFTNILFIIVFPITL